MKQTLLLIALVFSLDVLSHNIPGEKSHVYKGVVMESGTIEKLSGVKVSVKNTDIVTFTDRDGNFILENLPSGQFELEFSLVSFTSEVVAVESSELLEEGLSISLQSR
jgi:hypothetical protein